MVRRKFDARFKAKVALEAIKGEKTMSQLSSDYGVHPNQISKWKKELMKGVSEIFNKNNVKQETNQKEKIENLYKSIGELKVENDWLKKNWKFWIKRPNTAL